MEEGTLGECGVTNIKYSLQGILSQIEEK